MRYFFLYADNNKYLSRKNLSIKPADSRLAKVVVCEETKDNDQNSNVKESENKVDEILIRTEEEYKNGNVFVQLLQRWAVTL